MVERAHPALLEFLLWVGRGYCSVGEESVLHVDEFVEGGGDLDACLADGDGDDLCHHDYKGRREKFSK